MIDTRNFETTLDVSVEWFNVEYGTTFSNSTGLVSGGWPVAQVLVAEPIKLPNMVWINDHLRFVRVSSTWHVAVMEDLKPRINFIKRAYPLVLPSILGIADSHV